MTRSVFGSRIGAILIGLVLGVTGGGYYAQAQTTGNNGAGAPALSGANTWSGTQTFTQAVTVNGAGSSLKGGVTITTPTSGVALTVNGFGSLNNPALTVQGANTSGARGLFVLGGTTGSTDVALLVNDASSTNNLFQVQANGTLTVFHGGSAGTVFGSTGAVTVNAPSSGPAVNVTGISGQLALAATQPVGLPAFTVATLPTCNTTLKGGMAYVTDATTPTYNGTLTGGSSTIVPVFCNGSAWTSH